MFSQSLGKSGALPGALDNRTTLQPNLNFVFLQIALIGPTEHSNLCDQSNIGQHPQKVGWFYRLKSVPPRIATSPLEVAFTLASMRILSPYT